MEKNIIQKLENLLDEFKQDDSGTHFFQTIEKDGIERDLGVEITELLAGDDEISQVDFVEAGCFESPGYDMTSEVLIFLYKDTIYAYPLIYEVY